MWKGILIVGAAFAAASVPVAFSPAGEPGIFQIGSVCAQATACKQMDDYICSTFHNDHVDYVCSSGCAEEKEEQQ